MSSSEDKGRWGWDIEASGLLDDSTVDYTASPWKLKDNFTVHCIVAVNADTGEVVEFVQEECYTHFKPWVEANVKEVIHFNGINYDMPVCKAAFGMDFSIGPDTWCGKPVVIEDLYILSKTLNPDRRGHSVDYFGQLLGEPKTDWRKEAIELGLISYDSPKGAEFAKYHPRMLAYNKQDVIVTLKIKQYLRKEWGEWDWSDAYELEKAVADIIARQSHRGFWFDYDAAIANVKELDILMEERRSLVEPHLPEKPMGKTKLKDYTPCKSQFLKNGTPSTHVKNFCVKHGGDIVEKCGVYSTTLYNKEYTLPMALEPIISTEPSKITDSTFIKQYLVELGWKPTQYKERDLTVDSKKQKLSPEKFVETVRRYVEQTLSSPFKWDRCERVHTGPSGLEKKLLGHDLKKPLKVYTNPTLTVGQEKEIDPALVEMESDFPYVQQIVEYLTYNHRRNSILGGGVDPDEWEEDEEDTTSKGFLGNYRSDGRVPTPADTCGASTGRMKHKICANIPRVTTLYGDKMRALFGVGPGRYLQYAYDFASLEGRIEAHYCFKYDEEGQPYCNSLIQEKPYDVHTVTANKIAALIGQAFPRQSAKAVKYACTYGAQAARVAKTIGCSEQLGAEVFEAFWQAAFPLAALKEAVEKYWTAMGKKFVVGIDGRKINTRSQHALLNSLFQSAGVICAKRVMVFQDQKYKEMGIAVDFWKDDWKNKSYVQQLIAYHDEAQFEVTRDLVKWKSFPNKESMKEFQVANPSWINPAEKDGKWYLANSPVNDVAMEAVDLTNTYYKIKVPLAIDPQFGRTWGECH